MNESTYTARFFVFALFLCATACSAQSGYGIANLRYFQEAYPDVVFEKSYDRTAGDWKIDITFPAQSAGEKNKTTTLYWAKGRLLPEEELVNKEKYWTLLHPYSKQLVDPADFTPEQVERVKRFSSSKNRKDGAGTPMFFFDALYDSSSRKTLEPNIIKTQFLERRTNIHERIMQPLKRVEAKILELAKTDSNVKAFIAELKSTDAYYWRIIKGTNRKSFHSLGIAIDVLPRYLNGKAIFWSWTKEQHPDDWMLTPLAKRWMPPQSVISIFEQEGFIWGGKWDIFDNMHFEYHPELILFAGIGSTK